MKNKILIILLVVIMVFSIGCSSNSSSPTPTNDSRGRSIEKKIENNGYTVKGFITSSDDSDKYYCYINGNTSIVRVNNNEILVTIYDNENNLIDAFTLSN